MFKIPGSVKNWFGHDRKERRGTAILLVLIAIVITVRFTLPESKSELQEIYGPDEPEGAIRASDAALQVSSQVTRNIQVKSSSRTSSFRPKKAVLELNSCDSAALVSLPGIGPVLSARIIKFRTLLGGFVSVDQLKEVYGLPPETFNMIKDRLKADTSLIKRIRINSAGYRELSRLPYFEKYDVSSILKYREINKRIGGMTELVDNKILTPEKADRARLYIDYN